MRYWYAALFLLCFATAAIHADVTLPALIDHHMVIQRGTEFPVWGWAEPGERVTVEFNGQTVSSTAGSDRRWRAVLAPMSAGGPFTMTIRGNTTIVLYNILIGDVWVCTGQSNMEWPVKYCDNADGEIAAATHPKLRLIEVKKTGRGVPQDDIEGQWQECTPHSVGDITGVGYFFCRDLMKELDVPIGLVMSVWGGTSIQQWTSREAMESDPETAPLLVRYRRVLDNNPREMNEYFDGLAGWFEYCFVQMHLKWSYNPIPEPPDEYKGMQGVPSWLYNGMIAPLTWMPVKGFAWYQGESNSGNGYLYRRQLPLLIADWRRAWGRGDLPFLIVQLANWQKREEAPGESSVAELREAQLMTALQTPATALAVTIDLGEEDVHFRSKQPAGERLAKAALKIAYGRDIPWSGPVYTSMKVSSGRAHLSFDHAGSGLMTPGGEPLKGFAIAGADRRFVWAEARIEGSEVVVWSDEVGEPASVRYGWGRNPAVNLNNRDGFPASPFRTDSWPGVSEKKR